MVYIFAVTLVNDAFSLQHSSGFVSLRPFLFDCGCAVIVGILGFVISHDGSCSRGAGYSLRLVQLLGASNGAPPASAFPLCLKAVGGAVAAVAASGASDHATALDVGVRGASRPSCCCCCCQCDCNDCLFHFSSPVEVQIEMDHGSSPP